MPTTCSRCHGEINDRARFCEHCGMRFAAGDMSDVGHVVASVAITIGKVIAAMILGVVAIGFGAGGLCIFLDARGGGNPLVFVMFGLSVGCFMLIGRLMARC